ncbi:hypothetical protein [Adhaeribacter terreus]|uniref:Bulb-type lectin domain-containing protein n=1 Tax=Adhaeribacter terreus TaxID=529703 RepID=A0ABW0E9W5_9BACT
MKKIYLILLLSFLCFFHKVFAQTPTWQWAQAAIGSQGLVAQNGIGVDAAGNTYITGYGYTSNGINFGNTTLPPIGMFLAKYNAAGKLVWAKHRTTSTPIALYTDAAGNGYITGRYRDTLRAGNTTFLCQGFSDIFVMKFDSAGNMAWARKAGGPGYPPGFPPPILSEDEGRSIAADTAGNVYVSGFYFATQNTTATFDSISFSIPANSPINYDYGFLAKYNAFGHIQWVRRLDFRGHRPEVTVSVNKKGDCFVTGYFGDTLYLSNNVKLGSKGRSDAYYARYNTNGNLIWAKSFGGADDEFNQRISVNKQDECFLSGTFNSPNLPIGNTSLSGSTNRGTVYIAKCDSSGNIIWATQTTGSGSIGDSDMAIDTAGNAYLASSFTGTVTIGQQTITASSGTGSLAVSKWSSSGVPLWAVTAQGRSGSFHIAAGGAPDVCYISGDFEGSLGLGIHSLYSQNFGVFAAKLNSNPTSISEAFSQELFPLPESGAKRAVSEPAGSKRNCSDAAYRYAGQNRTFPANAS